MMNQLQQYLAKMFRATICLSPVEKNIYLILCTVSFETGRILIGNAPATIVDIMQMTGYWDEDLSQMNNFREIIAKLTKLRLIAGCEPSDDNPNGYSIPLIIDSIQADNETKAQQHLSKAEAGRIGGLKKAQNRVKKIENSENPSTPSTARPARPEDHYIIETQFNNNNNINNNSLSISNSMPTLPTNEQEAIDMMAGSQVPEEFTRRSFYELDSIGFITINNLPIKNFRSHVIHHYLCTKNKHAKENPISQAKKPLRTRKQVIENPQNNTGYEWYNIDTTQSIL